MIEEVGTIFLIFEKIVTVKRLQMRQKFQKFKIFH